MVLSQHTNGIWKIMSPLFLKNNNDVDLISNVVFLSSDECDFLISYHQKQKKFFYHDSTKYLRMMDIPFYHFKVSSLWKKIVKIIEKDIPYLKLSHGQLVYWPTLSSQELHIDSDVHPSVSCGDGIVHWSSVCYLNDDYVGGSTLIADTAIEPLKGRLILFNSKENYHGVDTLSGNRYVLTCWWRDVRK